MKGKVYQNCKIAMVCESRTWCSEKNEVEILQRSKRAKNGLALKAQKNTTNF